MPSPRTLALALAAPLALALLACSQDPRESPKETARAAEPSKPAAPTAPEPPAADLRPAPVREGGALVRGARDEAIYIADEDHSVVRVIPLRVDGEAPAGAPPKVRVDEKARIEVSVPGAPAQVLALDNRILVTIRDPGMLLVMRPDPTKGLLEEARIPLPPDAWGVAVTPDEETALVSSAWSNKVSAIDLNEAKTLWSLDTAREPRAIVIRPDGQSAYITHLMGRSLTRIDDIKGQPSARPVDLPPAPASAPIQGHPDAFPLDASLAYSAALSPDGDRLFVPRHALGAYGRSPWFGRATVDVLLTADDSPLMPTRTHAGMISDAHPYSYPDQTISADGQVPLTVTNAFTQPRAIAFRRSAKTLLVAGEGDERLAELDARSLDPALKAIRIYEIGAPRDNQKQPGDTRCGAPSGLALSPDESQAFLYCRSTGDLAIVTLDPPQRKLEIKATDLKAPAPTIIHIADDSLSEQAALGRRLFYSAVDPVMSEGLGCAGCHPDGRDDGHVWIETHDSWGGGGLVGGPTQDHGIVTVNPGRRSGFARQTPILVSRVAASGPYGWHGEGKSLEQRIMFGFGIHRWEGDPRWIDLVRAVPRASALASFLREGLVPPPTELRELTAEEQRGRAIFNAAESMCATCHAPTSGYTDRSIVKLRPLPAIAPYEDEPVRPAFKTPSLLFVGRSAPYFHDGRFATLDALIDENHDRMGLTDHLSREDRAALVAFLKTIGTVSGDADSAAPAKSKDARLAPRKIAQGAAIRPASLVEDRSSLALDPPAADSSARPSKAEWESASAVEIPMQSPMCKIHRVREWIRVRCPLATALPDQELAQVTLIAGPKDGVEVASAKGVAEMIFPARRGDRRLLEVDRLVFAWKSWVIYDGTVVVSEAWLPGVTAPEITVSSEPYVARDPMAAR